MKQDCINFFLAYVREQLKSDRTEDEVDYFIDGLETFLEELRKERKKELKEQK